MEDAVVSNNVLLDNEAPHRGTGKTLSALGGAAEEEGTLLGTDVDL